MSQYDVVVIGAGIHGAGVAQAAAAAGYRVLVLEKNHVAAGTSCRSSKLIHGGLRYLESAQFSLVRKSLGERAVLCRLAPGLVKLIPFYIPVYRDTSRRPWQVRLGLSLYALLGNLHQANLFKRVRNKDFKQLDQINTSGLQKVYCYYDGQTDDKKLTQAVIQSAQQLGVEVVCSANITSITSDQREFNLSYRHKNEDKAVTARVVVNASGPWVNETHKLVKTETDSLDIDLVQGTHIVLDVHAPCGVYYLEAMDRRAVFVMPYHYQGEEKTLVGTTETLFQGLADDVKALPEEIEYLLKVYKKYFTRHEDVQVIHHFAGLRVLAKVNGSLFSRPRDTQLHWSMPGMLSLYGGKLTAYRATSDAVIKMIKPLLPPRRRIAYTDQLYLKVTRDSP